MMFLRFLLNILLALSITAYKLDKQLDASNFFDSFDYINGNDKYQNGCASYVSKDEAVSMGLARVVENLVYIGVDNTSVIDVTPQGGRKSVRLESHDTIDYGLIIADFEHLPGSACGMWPAFRLLHTNTHDDDFYSEIDIVESVSYFPRNEINMFTEPTECTVAAQEGTGEVIGTNCSHDAGGCGVVAPYGTFGDSFNMHGGGIWATQIEAEGIKIWFFTRTKIPKDIDSDTPNPSQWGKPVMSFVPRNCDICSAWKKMKIVINITFCGASAGGDAWNEYTRCHIKTGVASCNDYVAKTPSAFSNVFFLIHSVKTYV